MATARVVTTAQHDEIPAYLNAMDVLRAPSQTTPRWREQFGRMLIEAFAPGASPWWRRRAGRFRMVGDGLVVAEDDLAGWQQAIEMLTTERLRRCELARRGRERAESVRLACGGAAASEFFERVMSSRRSRYAARRACADFPEEQWPSMDRVANELAAEVQRNHSAEVHLTSVCPPPARGERRELRGRDRCSLSIARSTAGGTTLDVERIAGRHDVSHVIDHSLPSSFTIWLPRGPW